MNKKYEMLIIGIGIWVICLSLSVANAGMLVYWAFDEGNGNSVGDSSGNNHNGTIHGAEWTCPGHDGKGYCLYFSGSGDYVTDDTAGKYLNDLDGLTITIWIKSNETGTDKGFVYCENPVGSDDRGIRYDATGVKSNSTNLVKISVKSNAGGTMRGRQQLESSSGVQTTEWQHIAMTWTRGEQLKLYINGKLDSPMANSLGLPGTLEGYTKLIIGKGGKDTNGSSWDGLIDDVAVFNYPLDEDEIFHVYQGGAALFRDTTLLNLSNSLREAKRILRDKNPQKVITLITMTITQYEQWQEKNPNDVKSIHKTLISDLYFLLARAQEAADVPIQDVIETYKHSISQATFRPNYVFTLLWLFTHIPAIDYINVIRESIADNSGISANLDQIAENFESSGNWVAFKFFLDAVFSEVNDSTPIAQNIAAGLMEDGSWSNNFLRYANNNPKLQQYYFKNSEQLALEKIIQNDFKGAADLYRDIVSQFCTEHEKLDYELKILEFTLKQGKYEALISGLNNYISKNNSIDDGLIAKANVLKGQAYIQLNEIDRACDTFSLVVKEYPETAWTPEAVFFIGYCHMLQGKHIQAEKTFNIFIDQYSYSPYARKASLCLAKL
jgi:tetratricopeptide (TPR) repeat protein